MGGHRQMPSNIKPRLFISWLNETNDRAKFYYWDGRKNLLFSVSVVRGNGYRVYKGFLKQSLSCSCKSADVLAKTWC